MAELDKMVRVPQSFLDDVQTLLTNFNDLGGKVDTLSTSFEATLKAVADSQKTISDDVQTLLQRTAQVPDVNVADLANRIQAASANAADEVQKAGGLVDEVNSFGASLQTFTQGIADQAGQAVSLNDQAQPVQAAEAEAKAPADPTASAGSGDTAPPTTGDPSAGSSSPDDSAPAGDAAGETKS